MPQLFKSTPGYGQMDVQYWQLTSWGVQRIQQGLPSNLDVADRHVLMNLVDLGGRAEIDEIKLGTGRAISSATIFSSLKRLVDLGYVTPLVPEEQTTLREG